MNKYKDAMEATKPGSPTSKNVLTHPTTGIQENTQLTTINNEQTTSRVPTTINGIIV